MKKIGSKIKRKTVFIAVIASLLIAGLSVYAAANLSAAEDKGRAMRMKAAGIRNGHYIHIGETNAAHEGTIYKTGDDPRMQWRVLDVEKDNAGNSGAIFMMTEKLIGPEARYAKDHDSKMWNQCNRRGWYNEFEVNVFSEAEQNAIRHITKRDYSKYIGIYEFCQDIYDPFQQQHMAYCYRYKYYTYDDQMQNQGVFPMSYQELYDYLGTGSGGVTKYRHLPLEYQLRSPVWGEFYELIVMDTAPDVPGPDDTGDDTDDDDEDEEGDDDDDDIVKEDYHNSYDLAVVDPYGTHRINRSGGLSIGDCRSKANTRPCMNINQSSILFSNNLEMKEHLPLGKLSPVKESSGNSWELTLEDPAHRGFSAAVISFSKDTDVATIAVSGAKTGQNEYISAIIADGDQILWYGRIADCKSTAPESIEVKFDEDMLDALDGEDCRFYVFSEKCRGYRLTDYASPLDYIDIYEMNHSTVTFDMNGHGSPCPEPQSIRDGGTLAKPEDPAEPGYIFGGWYTSPECKDGDKWDFDNGAVNGPFTLYAKWTPVQYRINFDKNGGNGTMQPQNRTYGEGTPLPECAFEPQDRYHFTGWNEKADGSGMMHYPGDTDDLSTEEGADVTLYAQWSDKYKVGYSLNGHGIPLPPDVEIGYPWILEEPESPKETGYIFGGWYTSPECKDDEKWDFDKPVQADMVLYAKWTPITYTVHFDGNGGEGIMDYQVRVYDSGEPLPENEFTYDDYHITSWNLKRDGSGKSYPLDFTGNLADEQDADVTLYAQWEHSYTVHFDANNGSGKMADQERCYSDGLSLPDNGFTRDHYTFEGWNTRADGRGTPYPDGYTGDIRSKDGETVTLFAQWMGNRCTLHFDANGGTGEMEDQKRIYDDGLSLPPAAFTRDKYTFLNWNTRRDGKGDSYPDGYTGNVFTDQSSMTLYAQWGNDYTVHYDPNGGTGNMADQERHRGDGLALTKNSFTRDGYAFVGWNTRPGGRGKKYKDEDKADLTDRAEKTVTLYAQWERAYTIHYDPNGGSGDMGDQLRYENDGRTLSKVGFGNQHRAFEQWNTRPDGKGTSYADESGADIPAEPGGTVTLYAQWRGSFTVTFNTNNGSMEKEYERTTDGYGHVRFPDDPEPADPEESFYGWYTQRSGGIRVGSDACFGADTVLYAHYRGLYNPPKNTARTITFHPEPEYADIIPYPENNRMTTSDTGLISNMPVAMIDRNVFGGWYTMPGGGGIRITDGMVIWEDIDVYSYFCTYCVFFDGNSGEGSMEEQLRSDGDGKTLPLNEFTRDGYRFTGWNTEKNGSGEAYPDGYLGDIGLPGYTYGYQTLYAQWEPLGVLPRAAFFDLNGHGDSRPPAQIVGRAQKWKLSEPDPDPSAKGYTFTGWYRDEDCREEWDFDNDSLEQLVTRLYAGWEASAYTVSFRANEPDGKTADGSMKDQTRSYDDGQALTANGYAISSDEPYEEFTFGGWNTRKDGSGDAFADEDTQNITDVNGAMVPLYAQWNRAQITTASLPEGRRCLEYSASLSQQGVEDPVWRIVSGELIEGLTFSDGVISGTPLQAETGRDITVQLKGKAAGTGEAITLTRELTLSILEQEPVQVVFDTNGHGKAPDPALAVAPEWRIPEPDPAPEEEGYTLEGWYTDTECTDGNKWDFSSKVTSDMVLYAGWTPNRYTVNFEPGKGSGSMDAQSRVYGDGKALPACTFAPPALANGAVFREWNTKADGSGKSFEDGSTQDIATGGAVTLYAQWSESRVAVFRLNGRGSGCPAPQIRGVMHGFKLEEPAEPEAESGYVFKGWYLSAECRPDEEWDFDNDSLTKPLTVLYAGWKPVEYTVKFDANPPGKGLTVEGSMENQDRVFDDGKSLPKNAYSISDENDPGKSFIFTGWNTEADGSGDAFADKDTQNITDVNGAKVPLYAQWNRAQITTSRLPRGTQGEAYSAALTQMGLTHGSWRISLGKLPEGMSLDGSTGVISGTSDQAGTFSFTAEVSGTDMMGGLTTLSKELSITIRQIDPEPLVIMFTGGMNGIWTKGGSDGLKFRTNGPFEMFVSLDVDGKELVKGSDYEAASGSTLIDLKPAMLEKLSEGSHILTAHYNDGQEPFTQFTVAGRSEPPEPDDDDDDDEKDKPKPDNGDNIKPSPDNDDGSSPGGKSGRRGAATGDEAHVALWTAALAAAMMLMAVQAARTKRRKNKR